MKFRLNLQRIATSCAALAILGSCGDNSDNPDAISLEDLRAPGGLTITDNGDGSIVLKWFGTNNEDDFQGYNIYGAKGTPADLGVTDGSAIQLLDQKGKPITAAKSVLEKFNYNPDSPFALYGRDTAPWLRLQGTETTTKEEKDKKFSFLPIHNKDADKKPILPTCQPGAVVNGTTTCNAVTSEKTRKDEGDVPLNGSATYSISGLTAGASYCFFVFSVQDEGEEISQTSSEVRCVVPRIEISSFTITTTTTARKSYDLDALVAACSGYTCPAFSAHETNRGTETISSTSAKAALPLHFETYSTGEDLFFVAGANSGIRDLGAMQNGFSDKRFDGAAPKFEKTYNETTNKVQNGGGYSIPFASINIKAKHMYVIATPDATETAKYRYHFLFVDNATDPTNTGTSAGAVSIKARYSLTAE